MNTQVKAPFVYYFLKIALTVRHLALEKKTNFDILLRADSRFISSDYDKH